MILLAEPGERKIPKTAAELWRLVNYGGDISLSQETVLGMRALRMTVPTGGRRPERLRRRVISLACRFGVNTVFLREDFPCPEWFAAFRRPDGEEFRRRMMGKTAVFAAECHDSVFVYLRVLDKCAERALCDLFTGFRHVMLSSANERALSAAETAADRAGVSIITDPPESRILKADAAVILDKPERAVRLGDGCVAVTGNYGDSVICSRRVAGVEYGRVTGQAMGIPGGFSAESLIFESVLTGMMSFDDFCVKRTEIFS